MDIKVILHKEEDGYWAEVPALKGCFSQGDTVEETLENIKEAVNGWLSAEIPSEKYVGNYEVLSVAI